MAWNYARYIQEVAAAGKQCHALPFYVNAQLPAPKEGAGEYPSGGPHPYYLAVYRAAAPAVDFYSPDIYWPNFEYWIDRYRIKGNAVFVPEARSDAAPFNVLYAFGEAKAFGFSPFGLDSSASLVTPEVGAASKTGPEIGSVYAVLESMNEELLAAQAANRTRGLVLRSSNPRPAQTVALGEVPVRGHAAADMARSDAGDRRWRNADSWWDG